MPIEKFLVAHARMLEEIREFRCIPRPHPDQRAMLDLLEVVEGGSTLGLDARVVMEELLAYYKRWKFGVDGRYEKELRSGERGSIPTWPFLDEVRDQAAPRPSNPADPELSKPERALRVKVSQPPDA